MRYKEPTPISREDAISAFTSHDPDVICDALVRATFYDPDWEWLQNNCLRLANSEYRQVRQLAITCLGHIARIHGKLDTAKVFALFESLKTDELVKGAVEDALDDIKTFLGIDPSSSQTPD